MKTLPGSGGVTILRTIEVEPRPETHHRYTVKVLFNPDFLAGLKKFVGWEPRSQCGHTFLWHVGVLRLTPVVETTIEEKHARTTVARRAHHIGPARISLANRLPWMERSISQGRRRIAPSAV